MGAAIVPLFSYLREYLLTGWYADPMALIIFETLIWNRFAD